MSLIILNLSTFIFSLLLSTFCSNEFRMYSQKARIRMINSNISIRKGGNDDIPRVAKFLSESMYSNIPTGQKRELARLEQIDLTERYGERVSSKGSLPSVLFIAEEDEEILGVVGLDCQLLRSKANKITKIPRNYFLKAKANINLSEDNSKVEDNDDQKKFDTIVFVLANLSVRIDKRKRGIARQLLEACDSECKRLGCEEIYLLVDSQNIAAQKLYKSSGYKLIFEDPDSTCVISTITGLQTASCTNLCFKKDLRAKALNVPPQTAASNILSGLLNLFSKN